MSPNQAGYQGGVVAPEVFAKTGSLALQNTQPADQPAGDSRAKTGYELTISRQKPGPETDHATEDDRKLL